MGAPVTKQKKVISQSQPAHYNSYYEPSRQAENKIMTNVIKRAQQKLSYSDSKATKTMSKFVFDSDQKRPSGIPEMSKRSFKDDQNFYSINSYRSDIDNIPQDDSNVIAKFMNDTRSQGYKRENSAKIININCDFEKRLFELPEEVFYLVLSFVIDEYYSLVAINSLWYYKINEVLDNMFIQIDNMFIQSHMSHFILKKGYNSFTLLTLNKNEKTKKFRLDRNLLFELLPSVESNFSGFNTPFISL